MRLGPRPLRRIGALALLLLFAGGSLPGHLHAAGDAPHPAQGHTQGHTPGHTPGHTHGHDHAPADGPATGHAHAPEQAHAPEHAHSPAGDPAGDEHSGHESCPGCLCPAGTAGCLALSTPSPTRAGAGEGARTPATLPRADAPPPGTLLSGIFRPPRG